MISHILVAYDGSEHSDRAFGQALFLAATCKARMTVLSIIVAPRPPEEVEAEANLEQAQEQIETRFKLLEQDAAAHGVPATFEIRVGHPAQHIVEFAKDSKSDLIVVGHNGKSLIKRLMSGSVSRAVMEHAHCSVLIAR
jgi:nucleotide-binding universal stress UspA family protein